MRKNKRPFIVLNLLMVLVIVLTLVFGNRPKADELIRIEQALAEKGYSTKEISQFKATLDPADIIQLSTQAYQVDAISAYTLPHYTELIKLGYTRQEARFLSAYDFETLMKIMKSGYIDEVLIWLKTPYMVLERLDRYTAYHSSKPSLSLRTVVERVNADRDYAPYTHVMMADMTADILLVNKYHQLPSSFVPSNLVQAKTCGSPTLTQEAADAYDKMCADVLAAGLTMTDSSSYRSFTYQTNLYNYYVKQDGVEATDRVSARPGFSEHQTGLAVDISNGLGIDLFVNTQTYQWVSQNCARYGFIMRYPKGKEEVTGYSFESWHYRYVGVEVAQAVMEKGLTLDEYILLFQ